MEPLRLLCIFVDFKRSNKPQGVVVILSTSFQGMYTKEVANLLQIIRSKTNSLGVMINR